MTARFVPRPRHGLHTPIESMQEGKPPGFVVACLDCGFSHDAHGATAEDAVKATAPRHDGRHRLTAFAVDYLAPTWGKDRNEPHPLYR